MADYSASFEVNRALWNARTRHHVGSKFYDVEGFLKGANPLGAHELELLGDVRGRAVLHLQCHFGLDTLSLARMGARATGLDLSDEAIAEARKLAERAGVQAEFVLANVLDAQPGFEGRFDLVFTSYGVLGWLPDLRPWARNVARWLKPGGRLVLVEFHPAVWMFNNEFTQVAYSYFNRERIVELEEGTYADTAAPIALPSHTWNHPLAESITALLESGLRIERFTEQDGSPHDCFVNTVRGVDGLYRIQGMEGKLPMVFSVVASRAEAPQ